MPGFTITDEELDTLLDSSYEEPPPPAEPKLRTREQLAKQYPNQAANLPCPVCRRPLALKDGKFGVFYGCNEYPRCRGTVNANQATAAPDTDAVKSFLQRALQKRLGQDVSPELRKARREAEDNLEQVWKTGGRKKKAVEELTAKRLGRSLCFEDLTVEQCEQVVAFAKELLRPKTRFDLIDEFDE